MRQSVSMRPAGWHNVGAHACTNLLYICACNYRLLALRALHTYQVLRQFLARARARFLLVSRGVCGRANMCSLIGPRVCVLTKVYVRNDDVFHPFRLNRVVHIADVRITFYNCAEFAMVVLVVATELSPSTPAMSSSQSTTNKLDKSPLAAKTSTGEHMALTAHSHHLQVIYANDATRLLLSSARTAGLHRPSICIHRPPVSPLSPAARH
jgi:hypothetical protein